MIIESKNSIDYKLYSNNESNEITKKDGNIYELNLRNNEHNQVSINLRDDTIAWKLQILNNDKLNFNLTFTPDYLKVIKNLNKKNIEFTKKFKKLPKTKC